MKVMIWINEYRNKIIKKYELIKGINTVIWCLDYAISDYAIFGGVVFDGLIDIFNLLSHGITEQHSRV